MSPAIREAIEFAENRAAKEDSLAAWTDRDASPAESTTMSALALAADIVAHRREAARWREIAAVLREVSAT